MCVIAAIPAVLAAAAAGGGAAAAGATAMTAVSLAGTIGSGVMAAEGAQQSAEAQAKAATYQSQVAANNAQIAYQQGNTNADAINKQGAQKLGMARAAMAGNGIDANSGSALSVQEGIGQNTGFDVANTRYNSSLQATGFRQQAMLDQSQAVNAQTAGQMGVASSLIGTASQFSSKWAGYQTQGMLSGGGGSSGNGTAQLAGMGVSNPYS